MNLTLVWSNISTNYNSEILKKCSKYDCDRSVLWEYALVTKIRLFDFIFYVISRIKTYYPVRDVVLWDPSIQVFHKNKDRMMTIGWRHTRKALLWFTIGCVFLQIHIVCKILFYKFVFTNFTFVGIYSHLVLTLKSCIC